MNSAFLMVSLEVSGTPYVPSHLSSTPEFPARLSGFSQLEACTLQHPSPGPSDSDGTETFTCHLGIQEGMQFPKDPQLGSQITALKCVGCAHAWCTNMCLKIHTDKKSQTARETAWSRDEV